MGENGEKAQTAKAMEERLVSGSLIENLKCLTIENLPEESCRSRNQLDDPSSPR